MIEQSSGFAAAFSNRNILKAMNLLRAQKIFNFLIRIILERPGRWEEKAAERERAVCGFGDSLGSRV